MYSLKQKMLAATCLSALGVLVGTADANAAPGDIWGGGASIIAPYWRQINDCYALQTPLIVKGTPPTFVTEPLFDYTKHPAQDCATTHIETDRTSYYVSATSGIGILAAFSHDPTKWGYIDAAQTEYAPEVHYGISETPLGATDVSTYDNGGWEVQGTSSVNLNTPTSGQTCNTEVSGTYANPAACYGPLVQIPVSIDPLAIAYSPTYEKVYNPLTSTTTSYNFNLHYKRAGSDPGGLRLNATTYCEIFLGLITNWNDPALKALNGNKSLEDPHDPTPTGSWSVPLQIVGRSDSAGATSTLTRHLAAVCPSLVAGETDYVTSGHSTLPTALLGPTYNVANPNYPAVAGETLGKFTLAPLNQGVAQYVTFSAQPGSGSNPDTIVQGRITYISPDYVLPYSLSTGNSSSYTLASATLENAKRQWEVPSPTTATAAYGLAANNPPPQSTNSGTYDAGDTSHGLRNDPADWVQSTSASAPLADPNESGAYPITGTANFVGYQCYASATQESTINGLLSYLYTKKINTDPKFGILASAGDAPLPTAWQKAIEQTFLENPDHLGLNFEPAGTAGTVCATTGIVGG